MSRLALLARDGPASESLLPFCVAIGVMVCVGGCHRLRSQVGVKRREDIAFGTVMGKDGENYKKKWR